jgi:hypothetical protein
MTDLSFSDAPIAIRPDIPAAHRNAWQRLAKPGAWWTGAERVAIAAEVRQAGKCRLCAERKTALSPYSLDGEHEASSDILPAAAIDVVHRIVTDASRLAESCFKKILEQGLSEGQYVEIVGTVVSVVSIDSFCRGIGVSLHPLPTPFEGEPSHYRPAGAKQGDAWVPWIPETLAKGPEDGLYGGSRTGNVLKAMSLVPEEVRGLQSLSAAHYLSLDRMMGLASGRSITRAQIELVAGRVSALNECFY